jgi:hypothetical protein
MTTDGYIKIDAAQKTGCMRTDNTTRERTVANAVAMGTTAGLMVSKELTKENFSHVAAVLS